MIPTLVGTKSTSPISELGDGVPEQGDQQEGEQESGIYFRQGDMAVQLGRAQTQRWLGLDWHERLDFRTAMRERIRLANASFRILETLVSGAAVPLHLAMQLFELKVDAVLDHGRWLWVLAEGAEQTLDETYEMWARGLLGAQAWRHAAPLLCEVGWALSGFARAVRATAMRRARLFELPDGDIYGQAFRRARTIAGTWAARTEELLASWGGVEWPVFEQKAAGIEKYRDHVK